MKWIPKVFLALLIVCFSSLLVYQITSQASDSEQNKKTIILAHGMHVSHPVSIAMDSLARYAEQYSDGQLKIEVYPSSQLGSERELLEQVQFGMVGITKVSGAKLENIVPAIRVFSLPYLFRDDNHLEKVLWGEVGNALLKEGEKYKLKGLAYYDAGERSFYTKDRPILHPDDLSGLKVRVQPSVSAMQLINTLSGSPTPLAYSELYTAFQGGIVDGAENNPPSFYSSRHYEVTNYYVLDEHTAVPDILVINTDLWNSLSDRQKKWLNQAVEQSVADQRKLWQQAEQEALREVKKAGIEVIKPDKEPFRKKVQPIYNQLEQHNPDLYQWVERIRQVQ